MNKPLSPSIILISCTAKLSSNNIDAIPQIIQKFKQSGCKNFFLIMAGVVPGSSEILSEAFFRQLKLELNFFFFRKMLP